MIPLSDIIFERPLVAGARSVAITVGLVTSSAHSCSVEAELIAPGGKAVQVGRQASQDGALALQACGVRERRQIARASGAGTSRRFDVA
jgi:hypothetical protein